MTRKPLRVSSFNPRLIVWWTQGSQAPTTVLFPTRRIATRIRQDLYSLRTAMRAESHYATPLADRAEVVRRPVDSLATAIDDPHTLIVRPAGFDINTALDNADIRAPDLDEDLAAPAGPNAGTTTHPRPSIDYEGLMKPVPATAEDGWPDPADET